MSSLTHPATTINPFPPASVQAELGKARCPQCGKEVTSLRCGHCGSRLPAWQADLYGALVRRIAGTGGSRRTDTGHEGGVPDGGKDASRTASGDERYTPAWLTEAVRQVMGGIDLDPASSTQANLTVQAARFYTRETDGLKNHWEGRIFLNPPFSTGLRPWVEKLAAEIQAGRVGQAFVIGPTDMLTHLASKWFRVLIEGSLFLPGERIEFLDPATGRRTGPRFGVFCSYWGPEQRLFVRVFGGKGVILQPAAVPDDRHADRPDGKARYSAPGGQQSPSRP